MAAIPTGASCATAACTATSVVKSQLARVKTAPTASASTSPSAAPLLQGVAPKAGRVGGRTGQAGHRQGGQILLAALRYTSARAQGPPLRFHQPGRATGAHPAAAAPPAAASPQQQPRPARRHRGVPPVSCQQALRRQAEGLWKVGEEPKGLRGGKQGGALQVRNQGRVHCRLGAARLRGSGNVTGTEGRSAVERAGGSKSFVWHASNASRDVTQRPWRERAAPPHSAKVTITPAQPSCLPHYCCCAARLATGVCPTDLHCHLVRGAGERAEPRGRCGHAEYGRREGAAWSARGRRSTCHWLLGSACCGICGMQAQAPPRHVPPRLPHTQSPKISSHAKHRSSEQGACHAQKLSHLRQTWQALHAGKEGRRRLASGKWGEERHTPGGACRQVGGGSRVMPSEAAHVGSAPAQAGLRRWHAACRRAGRLRRLDPALRTPWGSGRANAPSSAGGCQAGCIDCIPPVKQRGQRTVQRRRMPPGRRPWRQRCQMKKAAARYCTRGKAVGMLRGVGPRQWRRG